MKKRNQKSEIRNRKSEGGITPPTLNEDLKKSTLSRKGAPAQREAFSNSLDGFASSCGFAPGREDVWLFKRTHCWLTLAFFLAVPMGAAGQAPVAVQGAQPMMTDAESSAHLSMTVTPLRDLVSEVEQKNPQILAAHHAWKAAALVPSQVSTLPDPNFQVQQLSVGSPRPFAGYTNSDFAYVGFGISQDLPFPGKLRLKGEAAERQADAAGRQYEAAKREAVAQLKSAYFHLAYLQQTLAVLDRNGQLLEQIEKIAEGHYRVGQGSQADVLKAQLQRTELRREIAMHHQEMWTAEAQLRRILDRPPDSPDITTEAPTESLLPYTSEELLERARTQNPGVGGQQEMVKSQSLQVEMARKDFYPDFNLQYMWQHTGPQFRDYYTLTFGVRVPIFRSRKQRPELAQAVEDLNRTRREYEAGVQQAFFDVRDQFLAVQTSHELLRMYREGLIPQATAALQAGLAAYQSNRLDMQSVLSSYLDVLNFDEEYWKTLADHETALAQLEKLTGITL